MEIIVLNTRDINPGGVVSEFYDVNIVTIKDIILAVIE